MGMCRDVGWGNLGFKVIGLEGSEFGAWDLNPKPL